jgi:hypothetical protein
MSDDRIDPARLEICVAEEWHRDGRGLWAMRSCISHKGHSSKHTFERWRYSVGKPAALLAAEAPTDNGNIYVFCDAVRAEMNCVRGAGHIGPHLYGSIPKPPIPVVLAVEARPAPALDTSAFYLSVRGKEWQWRQCHCCRGYAEGPSIEPLSPFHRMFYGQPCPVGLLETTCVAAGSPQPEDQ